MKYGDTAEALKDGDSLVALRLLERAAQEIDYSSDIINDAYTLALYRAGERNRLADISFQIGDSFVETDPATAMDYLQRAFLGGLDAACVRHVGQIFERWSAPKSRKSPLPTSRSKKPVTKVAHVVGCLLQDHAPARHVEMLAKSFNQHGVQSQVFTTEWAASWFFNSSMVMQSRPSDFTVDAVVTSTSGNFSERADRVAAAIRASGIKVVFYHASHNEQITTRVASLRPAPIQINVVHAEEMDPAIFEGYVHLTRAGLSSTRHPSKPTTWIPAASNIEERLKACPPQLRQSVGLESATTVSATFGDLRRVSDSGYLRVLSGILKNLPQHFHLFAGPGDVKTVRAYLHAEGVLPRVRFLGSVPDASSVLSVTDVVLAPFSHPDEFQLTEAMGAGKPLVVLAAGSDGLAELIGVPELVSQSEAEYAQTTLRLLRDDQSRSQYSKLVLSRFRSEFAPSILGKRYLEFLKQLPN
jgi:hypothetical protein